jgi:hypothetical protein
VVGLGQLGEKPVIVGGVVAGEVEEFQRESKTRAGFGLMAALSTDFWNGLNGLEQRGGVERY